MNTGIYFTHKIIPHMAINGNDCTCITIAIFLLIVIMAGF